MAKKKQRKPPGAYNPDLLELVELGILRPNEAEGVEDITLPTHMLRGVVEHAKLAKKPPHRPSEPGREKMHRKMREQRKHDAIRARKEQLWAESEKKYKEAMAKVRQIRKDPELWLRASKLSAEAKKAKLTREQCAVKAWREANPGKHRADKDIAADVNRRWLR